MILKPSQAQRSNQHGVQHFPLKILQDLGSGHLPTCKRMYKGDFEIKAEAKSSYRTSHN